MHCNTSEASEKMIIDLISSAKNICILHGFCDYLGKINKDDSERLQESRRLACLSRASVADNSQLVLGLQRDTSQHEHHQSREAGLLTVRDRQRATSG